MFAIGTVAAVGLYAFTGGNAVLSVVFSALLTGSMHGVCSMLTAMIPPFFKKYGNVSTASGVLNACTYVGAAIATYGFAVLEEAFGWNFTILMWFFISCAGLAVCLIATPIWKKFRRDYADNPNV
jgi:OPA family glycerol-3-phosphate transporter-like MFS transporter